MLKKLSKRMAAILAMVMILTGFTYVAPVSAASKPDLKKANVSWDLKNNKTLKYKTTWSVLGKKTHTVKMTNYKVTDAKKKGYKVCTFTLTFKRKIKPTKRQATDMNGIYMDLSMDEGSPDNGPFGGGCYFTVVDYKTGKSLEKKNSHNVKVTSTWNYSNKETVKGYDGFYIYYTKTIKADIKIVFPKNYKNLAVGVGGYTDAPHYYTIESKSKAGEPDDPFAGSGVGTASVAGGITVVDCSKFWKGKKAFSQETNLYSKKDKSYAHFMRVKA